MQYRQFALQKQNKYYKGVVIKMDKDTNKKGIIKEFKEFISRGNVLDMAVGIIIGSAFTAIVTSLVNDIIMPFVGILMGGFDFTSLSVSVGTGDHTAVLAYGLFIQALINFLIIAVCVFILIRFINTVAEKTRKQKKADAEAKPAEPPKPSNEEVLLTEIRDLLKNQNEK